MGDRGPGAFTREMLRSMESRPIVIDRDATRAEKVIQFIQQLRLTADPFAGEPFVLREWQREIIRAWYRTDDNGRLIARTCFLSMARKNGKTGLCAGLAMCHLVGPESVQRGEIVVGATDSDQSGLIFQECCAFIDDNREFRAICKIKSHEKQIINTKNKSVFKALSSDAKKAHGLSPTVIILDELAQWGDGVGRRLYNALMTGQGVRKDPMKFIIGTQSDEDSAIMSQLLDLAVKINDGEIVNPKFSGFVYQIPVDDNVFDEATWIKANPAIDDFRSREEMRDFAENARRLPTVESTFRNLYCNQRTMVEPGLITREEWKACYSDTQRLRTGEEIYLGLDLSACEDLTALVAVSANDGERIKAWFWKPGDIIKEQSEADHLPYDIWVKEKWIDAPKGRHIDYRHIVKALAQINRDYRILAVAHDRDRIQYLMTALDDLGVAAHVEGKDNHSRGIRFIPWGQGFRDMAPAVDAFETSVLEGRLKHDGNPVLTICVANAKVDMDAAGNRKLDKSATRFRIDGAVAAAMAIGVKAKHATKAPAYHLSFV